MLLFQNVRKTGIEEFLVQIVQIKQLTFNSATNFSKAVSTGGLESITCKCQSQVLNITDFTGCQNSNISSKNLVSSPINLKVNEMAKGKLIVDHACRNRMRPYGDASVAKIPVET